MATSSKLKFENVHIFLESFLEGDVHAKRVYSLANATLGVMASASLAVHAIGQGLAHARGTLAKHGVKQVDRLLSNKGIEVWSIFEYWVPFMVAERKSIAVAIDWTEFDADGQSTIMLSMLTSHGRATPLIWLTVDKNKLKDHRNDYEDSVLRRLKEVLPIDVQVLIVADRGFGDHKLYELLEHELNFDFVIRFRGNIHVRDANGEVRTAAEWVGKGGRSRTLRDALVTGHEYKVGTVMCVQAKGMKAPWCLATNLTNASARTLIDYYAKRWSIEPGFRDTKDLHFGMGMSVTSISSPERRDRLWLLNAFAVALLTLLGAAGESIGYDRHLKSNTSKKRTHSLFRQGAMLYDQIPNMPDERLRPLVQAFNEMLLKQQTFSAMFGYI